MKRSPRVAESGWLSVPVTVGVLRPAILLPSGWRDWDQGELDAVISHEISHVARRDASVDRLALLHRALFWFSPLSWYLTRCLAELAEEASDEAALAAGADRTRYAETLLGFFSELEAVRGELGGREWRWPRQGRRKRRLDRILEWKGSVAMQLKKSVVVVLVMSAVPVVYVAAAMRPGVYDFQFDWVRCDSGASTGAACSAPQSPAPAPVASPAPVVEVAANGVVVTTAVAPGRRLRGHPVAAPAPVAS